MKYLPFNFESLSNGKFLISNMMGFFEVLDDRDQLEALVCKKPTSSDRQLKAKKFLFDQDEDISPFIQLYASSYAWKLGLGITSPYLFIIVPTLRCDHNCSYCQVSRVNEDKTGYDLAVDEIDNIISVIMKYGKPPYKIEFQGGEPLLNFEFIKAFIEKFSEAVSGAQVEYVVATSLSKLNDEVITYAKDRPIHFSVSLDGAAAIHNANRRHHIYDSFQKASHGIALLQTELGRDRVATVTTVTKELLDRPETIIDTHIELGLHDMFVRPLSPYGFASEKYNRYYSTDDYLRFLRRLLISLVKENRSYKLVEHNFLIHLERIFRKDMNRYVDLKSPAGHLMGAMIFNYDGRVFGSDEARMIYEQTKLESLSIGKLGPDFTLSQSEESVNILTDSFISEIPGCDECAYQPYCGVDPMYHLSTQQDHIGNRAISDFCKLQKGMFDILFTSFDDKATKDTLMSWLN